MKCSNTEHLPWYMPHKDLALAGLMIIIPRDLTRRTGKTDFSMVLDLCSSAPEDRRASPYSNMAVSAADLAETISLLGSDRADVSTRPRPRHLNSNKQEITPSDATYL